MIAITINTEPLPQSRPRFGNGKVYETTALRKYKSAVALVAQRQMAGLKPLTGALQCGLKFYRNFNETSRRFGDFDNLAKAVIDALNGIAFVDDSQITKCVIEKIRSERPRVEIWIDELKPPLQEG